MMLSILASALVALNTALASGAQDAVPAVAEPPAARTEAPAQNAPGPAAEPAIEPEPAEAAPALEGPVSLAPSEPVRARELEIARVEAWLEGLSTLEARFRQVADDGAVSEGSIYLARPGRARFAYDAPSPILIVADGASVAVPDTALETVDRAPIASTPLRWLLREDPDLAASGAVAEIGRIDGELFVTLRDPEGEYDGSLTLVFTDPEPEGPAEAMRLTHWFAVDAAGGVTQLELRQTERGERLDPRLFVLDDADGGDRRGRRRG